MSKADTLTAGTCFVICPIGSSGSPIRKRADQLFTHVFKPVAIEAGYATVERADLFEQSGTIPKQIITHLLNDDIVIADLTGHNANVFYELAVRHGTQKPCFQIMQDGEKPPFDVATMRTIFVDHNDLDSVADCKRDLLAQITHAKEHPESIDNPIDQIIRLAELRSKGSEDELRTLLFDRVLPALDSLGSLDRRVDRLERSSSQRSHPTADYLLSRETLERQNASSTELRRQVRNLLVHSGNRDDPRTYLKAVRDLERHGYGDSVLPSQEEIYRVLIENGLVNPELSDPTTDS